MDLTRKTAGIYRIAAEMFHQISGIFPKGRNRYAGLVVLLGIAMVMCSCTPRGGAGAQGRETQEGENSGDPDHAPSGEHVWNLTELPKPDGAVRVSTGDALFEHAAVMDSRDGGKSWEAADAGTSPALEDEVVGKYYSAEGIPFAYSSTELVLSADGGAKEKNLRIREHFAVNDAEDQVILSVSSPVSEQSKLYLLEWGAPKEEKDAPKEKLRIYSLKGSTIRQAATLFQEKHPELEVTFEIGYTGENGVTLPDAIRTLNTELMAGEGPDILILDGLPADSYVDKGMLEDLTGLVEPDKEKYFYNMISAYNGGGSIYQMPLEFCVPVILGDADVAAVKNRRELMEVLRKKAGTGIPFMVSENISEAALELFMTSDIAGKTIDEEKLADYYRDLDTIADLCFSDGERELFSVGDKMTYWAEQYPGVSFCPELDIYFGEAQAGITRIEAIWDYMRILPLCREKGLSYQYLNRENGNYFIAVSVLGICRGGKNPDAAKEFLRFYLSGETYGDGVYPYFPIIRELIGGDRYVSEEGESVGGTSKKNTPDKTMDMYKLTPAELEAFTAFLDGLDTPVMDDAVVMQKVMEQADACLFEGKDPESAAADACREVNLYLSE